MSKIVSETNWIMITITWPSPPKSCSTPSTGPARTSEAKNNKQGIRNDGSLLFFILILVLFGLYNLVW